MVDVMQHTIKSIYEMLFVVLTTFVLKLGRMFPVHILFD